MAIYTPLDRYAALIAFVIESKVKDMAQLAPTPKSASGEVFSLSVFTATNFFLRSTAFSIPT